MCDDGALILDKDVNGVAIGAALLQMQKVKKIIVYFCGLHDRRQR